MQREALERLPWADALRGCPQSPVHHAEGDVWTHVQMVVDELVASQGFRDLPAAHRQVLYWAAWMHDLAKPQCTRHEPEGITARGHARRGAIAARRWLWENGFDPLVREQICGLIRHHMVPFWLIEREDASHRLLAVAEETRCDWLAMLAQADARGRLCQDRQKLLDNIALFEELAREWGVWDQPFPFESPAARVTFFRRGGDPRRQVYFRPRCHVWLLSGLPAAGKDHWRARRARGLPQVSLDELRDRLGISPRVHQQQVVQAARARARELLRRGDSFVWNATHLSRELRQRSLELLFDYEAEVSIQYLEAPAEELHRRNQARAAPVPAGALQRMLERWEIPLASEAHEVVYCWGSAGDEVGS